MSNNKSKEIFSANLENLMSSRGIDRNKLCSDLGLKYTTVRDWLKGITYPRIGKIELLADYFGVNKSDLIEDKTQEVKELKIPTSPLVQKITEKVDSWDILWNEKYKRKIIMLDSSRDTIGITLKKLGYSLNSKNDNFFSIVL